MLILRMAGQFGCAKAALDSVAAANANGMRRSIDGIPGFLRTFAGSIERRGRPAQESRWGGCVRPNVRLPIQTWLQTWPRCGRSDCSAGNWDVHTRTTDVGSAPTAEGAGS